MTSGCDKFEDFPENQMTKFHAEFPILCRLWKYMNSPIENVELRLPVKQ